MMPWRRGAAGQPKGFGTHPLSPLSWSCSCSWHSCNVLAWHCHCQKLVPVVEREAPCGGAWGCEQSITGLTP